LIHALTRSISSGGVSVTNFTAASALIVYLLKIGLTLVRFAYLSRKDAKRTQTLLFG
jgi:hypothetical protein